LEIHYLQTFQRLEFLQRFGTALAFTGSGKWVDKHKIFIEEEKIMKSQSLKLFAIAFVLGLVTIFAAGSVNAQSKLIFEAPFEFHLGKDTLAAGKYELVKMDYGKYLLKNTDTKKARIVLFDVALTNKDESADQRVVFNRYGETYFLRGIFEKQGAEGREILESKYERDVRSGAAGRENQLAGEKAKPEQISVKMMK
jgi:hypothetical protein